MFHPFLIVLSNCIKQNTSLAGGPDSPVIFIWAYAPKLHF